MTSIRAFLIGVVLSAFTLLNFVAVLKGYDKGLDTAETILDEQLSDMAKLLAVHSTRITSLGDFDQTSIAYQVIRNKELRERSFNAPPDVVELQSGFSHLNFNRTRWRTYTHYESESDTWVWVAEPEYQRKRIAESVVLHTITPILVSIPVAGVLIWLIIGVGLRPLKTLSQQLQKKQPSDLSPLQPDSQVPAELAPVIQAVDELLTRLRQAFEREKHFAADAAHELRTPVSILKVHIHNLETTLHGYHPELQAVKHAVDQLAHLVEQLLDLYRSSPDIAFRQIETIDLERIAQEVLAEAFPLAQTKDQTLELVAEPTPVRGNPFALTTLLNNLVRNAIKYAPAGGSVRVTATRRGTAPVWIVEDSGPGIPEHNRQSVLQRFYRQDNAADRLQIGAGLGLAIVSDIVTQHNASLSLDKSADLGGLKVTIVFNSSGHPSPTEYSVTQNKAAL